MTAYEILKIGGTIEFPFGYRLVGDPLNNYIDTYQVICGEAHHDGLRVLDKNGVRLAIADAKRFEQISKSN